MPPDAATTARAGLPCVVTLPACMGGFCRLRMSCAHYYAADKRNPSQRLCARHVHNAWQPITMDMEQLAHHQLTLDAVDVMQEAWG